ncbi:hypothetical protein CSOJ01_06549 [Colletotrichum sojae]|uniref:Uncharacterized protein n=1 Tax=Colletotrichum sojae TaxID=2175907 RepID=A0A8H6JCA0_9PEZI|nr:hypothetical protein CSOJ01_06549 [Colletotrichum sojae]
MAPKALQEKRRRQQKAAESVVNIKNKCALDHGKNHVAHCKECYGEVVDTIRSRYADSPNEWFSSNAAFLKSLDGLFAKLKDFNQDLKTIQARIDKEKAKCYRETLPKTAAGRAAAASMGKTNFQAALEDEEKPVAALIEDVRRAVGRGVEDAPSSEELATKFDELVVEKETDVLIDVFFRDPKTGEILASCSKYVEKLRSGVSIEDVMAAIDADRPGRTQAAAQMDKHRRTLNELKRAQAAHEQDKLLKAQKRQQASPQPPRVTKEQYDLPPCHVCSGKVSTEGSISACPFCVVFAELSLTKRTVFHSECYADGLDEHVQSVHGCAAGDNCIQLKDEDEEMGGSGDGPVICEECAENLGQCTVYCSAQCASSDFQAHREGVHIPNWKGLGTDVDRQSEHLVYENVGRTRYHVNDISKFVWRLEDALERIFEANNPDVKVAR